MNQQASHGHEETLIAQSKPSKDNEERRVSIGVLNQPMHGGDTSTCPSKFLIKSGLIPIVKLALSIEKHIIANHIYHANNDNVLF